MFNLGAGEVLVILLLALIVLGPQRLPDAAKQVGRFTGEIRRLSNGFQQEMKSAFDAETETAARAKGDEIASSRPTTSDEPQPDALPAADAPEPAGEVDRETG